MCILSTDSKLITPSSVQSLSSFIHQTLTVSYFCSWNTHYLKEASFEDLEGHRNRESAAFATVTKVT